MTDTFSKKQRSRCMSRIRSKWTGQEVILHNYLKGNRIRHQMHPALIGNPDILLSRSKTVIFIDGCFWHKCKQHYRAPSSNKKYWTAKIERNVARDRENTVFLKKKGFNVLRFWEHELKNVNAIVALIKNISQGHLSTIHHSKP
ncbi:MAG: very short patch repair endonuclease [archaeon]